LINRLPFVSRGFISPWQILFGSTLHTLIFALLVAFVILSFVLTYSSHKFHPHSIKCVFLGYDTNAKGFLCYHIPSQQYYVSRHVRFDESNFPFRDSNDPLSSSFPSSSSSTWLNTLLYFHPCTVPSILGSPPVSSTLDNDVTSTAPVFIIHVVPSTHTHPIIPPPVSTTSSHPMTTPSKFGFSKKK
jgi:hypothetical protein